MHFYTLGSFVLLNGVRASSAIVHIRKFYKIYANVVHFRFFFRIAKRSIAYGTCNSAVVSLRSVTKTLIMQQSAIQN